MLPVAMALLLGPAMLSGCKQATVAEPLTQTLSGNATETQMQFWHTLGARNLASNDDAFHGVLLYLDGEVQATTYQERVAELKRRDILPQAFDFPATQAVNRGTLAIIISRVAQIRGGVFMQLFPDSARYATRELQFMGLYPRSSPNQAFSGAEFLGIIGRLEDYQRIRPIEAAPTTEDRAPADEDAALPPEASG